MGPRLGDRGPGDQRPPQALPSRPRVPAAPDTSAVRRYLLSLVDRCDSEVPLLRELRADQLGTPAGTASIARGALAWLLDGQPEAVEARLRGELAEGDWLVRWRIREAGLDVHGRGDIDWPRIYQVVTARAEYRQRWGVRC
jgi:hypothetical protein